MTSAETSGYKYQVLFNVFMTSAFSLNIKLLSFMKFCLLQHESF